jgi:DNA replication and repair protein RecF
MKITELTLTNYRNIAHFNGQFCAGQNLIVGQNGQGKTNLLEALYVLSNARSNRTNTDKELIKHGEAFCTLNAQLYREALDLPKTLEASFSLTPPTNRLKSHFKTQGNVLKSRSQVLGHLPTVSFFLSDLQLLRGTPEDRRRWVDTAAAQLSPGHFALLSNYNHIRLQKAKLLKQDQAPSPEHLAVWNQQLAEVGGQLMAGRLAYIQQVQAPLRQLYANLCGPTTDEGGLGLHYYAKGLPNPLALIDNTPSPEALTQALLAGLAQRSAEECRRGVCLVGPHRDDLHLLLLDNKTTGMTEGHSTGYYAGHDATSFASQGQQRSIVLALKLVELQLLTQHCGEAPVLLLDDVMAELDLQRQGFLLAHLSPQSQLFLTTTHLQTDGLIGLPPATQRQVFSVYNGVVSTTT